MKCTVSIALFVCFAAEVTANDPSVLLSGPIARAASREAGLMVAQRSVKSADSGWDRVRTLTAGSAITVVVRGAVPVYRTFIAATDSELRVKDFDQVVTGILRGDIAEIRAPRSAFGSSSFRRRHPAAFGAVVGAMSGIGVGLALFTSSGHSLSGQLCGSDGCRGVALLVVVSAAGAGIGAGVGAGMGNRVELLYSAASQ